MLWSFAGSICSSGGLITLWKKGLFEVISIFKGGGFLGIKLICRGNCYYIVNVYSRCTLNLKKKLWNDLLVFNSKSLDGDWCLGGDFNSIVNLKKIHGSSFVSRNSEMRNFSRFIEDKI